MNRFFEFERHGTSTRREILAGVTRFLTMSYIIIVSVTLLSFLLGVSKAPAHRVGMPPGIRPVALIPFDDYAELVPAFLTIVLMSFTYNIGVGMTAGLIVHPLLKAATGRVREVPAGLWVLAALAFSFYLFYPHR